MRLCLYGGARDTVQEVYINSAFDLGSELARRGHTLVFGGGDTGMMGAAARGVKRQGGKMLGIAPYFFNVPGELFPQCDDFLFTDTMRQRKQAMEDRSDGFIVLPGGIGTLDEFFEIFTLRSLDRHDKPVALYNVNGYYDELLAFLKKAESETFIPPETLACMGVFSDLDALFSYLEA